MLPFAAMAGGVESIGGGSVNDRWTANSLREIAMSQAVQEILERIQHLPEEDRWLLDEYLAQQAEAEWERAAAEARLLARKKGIDQTAIDLAVEQIRYAP